MGVGLLMNWGCLPPVSGLGKLSNSPRVPYTYCPLPEAQSTSVDCVFSDVSLVGQGGFAKRHEVWLVILTNLMQVQFLGQSSGCDHFTERHEDTAAGRLETVPGLWPLHKMLQKHWTPLPLNSVLHIAQICPRKAAVHIVACSSPTKITGPLRASTVVRVFLSN